MSEPTDVCEILLSLGWKEQPDQHNLSRCFFKRHETPTQCRCNSEKSGMQVGIYVSEWRGRQSMEMDVCGELSDGTWLTIKNYALPSDVNAALALIPRLLATWESAAA